MALFGKTGIDLLQELLQQVKGGIYILETKFEKKGNQLLIAFGTIANSDNQPTPFAGISVKVRVINEEDLTESTATENIKINGQEILVPQNIVRLFWDIISELSAELEGRIQKILSQPPKSVFAIKSVDIVDPFTIENRTASVRVELTIGDRRYQEELPPYQIFYMGSKGLFHYLLLRVIQHLSMQTFFSEGKSYIDIPAKSMTGNIPKFLQALSEVGMMNVILEDEEALKQKLEELQKKVQNFVKKEGQRIGIEKNYLWSENNNEFLTSGLELAYVVFLILGTPSRIPITVLTWVLDEFADDVIKDRLKEIDLELFYGEEEKLFQGLVEVRSDETLLEGIDAGFNTNLYEMKVDSPVKNFKSNIQKAIQKYDLIGNENAKKRLLKGSKNKKKLKGKEDTNKDEVIQKPTKAFVIFPAFDSAEKELRIREFAKEITIHIVSELEEEVTQDKFVIVSQNVLQTIRNMMAQNIIWTENGWVYFRPSAEDQVNDNLGQGVYKQILNWNTIKENLIKKRWGLEGNYDVVSYDDVFSIFKKDNFNGVLTELDHLFAIKRLFIRRLSKDLQTWKKRKSANEQQPSILQMLEPLVENPLKRRGMGFFWLKFKLHRLIKKMEGRLVLHGDLLRNIDYLDDILFIFNSRFGLEIPNSHLIEEVMTELHALENEGILKRYLFSQHAMTSIPINIPEKLSQRRSLLLQMITVITNRHNF